MGIAWISEFSEIIVTGNCHAVAAGVDRAKIQVVNFEGMGVGVQTVYHRHDRIRSSDQTRAQYIF